MSNNYATWSNNFNYKYTPYFNNEKMNENFVNANKSCSCGDKKLEIDNINLMAPSNNLMDANNNEAFENSSSNFHFEINTNLCKENK
jgi:hypothetical protein